MASHTFCSSATKNVSLSMPVSFPSHSVKPCNMGTPRINKHIPFILNSNESFSFQVDKRRESVSTHSIASVDTFSSTSEDDEFYEVKVHTVKVHDRKTGIVHEFQVPEDQYILHTGEDEGILLPFACRHGCCTACAVRIKSGELYQPGALGISQELKQQGYALLCVGIPLSDLEVETQDEDEVYWLQFGRYFAKGPVERDDYALELAMADE